MFTLIEALNFRCLKYINQPLGPFHVLVGPNASGKTTFLDVIAFLGDLVSDGLESAIFKRTSNFHDLVWGRKDSRFELAVEALLPEEKQKILADREYDTIRYEIALGIDGNSGETSIFNERVILKESKPKIYEKSLLFPDSYIPPPSIMTSKEKGIRTVVKKTPGGKDNYYSEVYRESGKGWADTFSAFLFGPQKSALRNLPGDEKMFPFSNWLKNLFSEGVQKLVLNSLLLKKPSPPGQGKNFKPDGSNLPWIIHELEKNHKERKSEWIQHLRTALPDLKDIYTIERPEDRHRYLILRYSNGMEIPSWMASDGTLRLLALTLPAYIPGFKGVYLIEEPENGIHPRAVETLFQSLSSVYDAQILLATHSPVILSMVDADNVLCFAKTDEGATDIVSGDRHPALSEWHGETNLGVLFAGGVLG